jgi:hypothetical protein
MLEMMYSGAKTVVAGAPLLGYNFDQGKSISSPLNTGYSGGIIEKHGSGGEIAGYTQSLRCVNTFANLTPLTALDALGTGDFTLECYAWMSTIPNDYYHLLLFQFKNGKYITIRVANSGYGSRMQVGIDIGNGANFSPNVTGTSLRNGWHHYALVRKNGKCRFFIDGKLQMLAAGTATTYTAKEFDANFDLSGGLTAATIGKANSGTGDIYMPEFVFSSVAKYTEDFTRPTGPYLQRLMRWPEVTPLALCRSRSFHSYITLV